MTNTNRTPRDLEERSTDMRPQQWAPAELLPEPDQQAGFKYRWIRISMLDKSDTRNLSSKLREGWEAVKIEEQPKFQLLVDPQSRFKDNIEVGGLLLCKTPSDFVAQRTAHFARQTQAQSDGVDNSLMRQSDSRMPMFKEGKSSSSFGKGS